MSRVFTDAGLMTWEAYASGGKFGLPDEPKIVFNCLSEPGRRARFVQLSGDEAGAEEQVHAVSEAELRSMLASARELD